MSNEARVSFLISIIDVRCDVQLTVDTSCNDIGVVLPSAALALREGPTDSAPTPSKHSTGVFSMRGSLGVEFCCDSSVAFPRLYSSMPATITPKPINVNPVMCSGGFISTGTANARLVSGKLNVDTM